MYTFLYIPLHPGCEGCLWTSFGIELEKWPKIEDARVNRGNCSIHTKGKHGGNRSLNTQFSSLQSLSGVWLFATPWIPARQASCPSPTPRIYSNSCPLSQWCIQPSCPLLSPSPPALSPSQHQGLFKWVNSSHGMAKVLEFQLQPQSFQWTPRTDFL